MANGCVGAGSSFSELGIPSEKLSTGISPTRPVSPTRNSKPRIASQFNQPTSAPDFFQASTSSVGSGSGGLGLGIGAAVAGCDAASTNSNPRTLRSVVMAGSQRETLPSGSFVESPVLHSNAQT